MKDSATLICIALGFLIFVSMVLLRNTRILTNLKGIDLPKVKQNLDKWIPDWQKFLYSVVVIAVINLMFERMTKTMPELWDFYYNGDSTFFWAFNFALVLFALFLSKRDSTGKQIPEAKRKAWIIMTALIIFSAVNFAGRLINRIDHPLSTTHVPTFPSKMQTEKVILRAICMAESGCRQFDSDGKVLRGNIDPDDTGLFQINKRIHAKLIKETGHDPETEEGNIALAKILLRKEGTGPWRASQKGPNGWESWLKKLSPKTIEPFTLALFDLPVEDWSEPVESPRLDYTRISWSRIDTKIGGKCIAMLDDDPTMIIPFGESRINLNPETIRFRCKEKGAKLRVSVVPDF